MFVRMPARTRYYVSANCTELYIFCMRNCQMLSAQCIIRIRRSRYHTIIRRRQNITIYVFLFRICTALRTFQLLVFVFYNFLLRYTAFVFVAVLVYYIWNMVEKRCVNASYDDVWITQLVEQIAYAILSLVHLSLTDLIIKNGEMESIYMSTHTAIYVAAATAAVARVVLDSHLTMLRFRISHWELIEIDWLIDFVLAMMRA